MKKTKTIFTSIFLVAVFLSGTLLLFTQEEDWTREEYKLLQKFKMAKGIFEKGKKFFLKKNYRKAEAEFMKCLEAMSEYADADFYLSQIYYNQGDLDKALACIEKAKKNYKFLIKVNLNREHQYLIQLRNQRDKLTRYQEFLRNELGKASDQEQQGKLKGEIWKVGDKIKTIDIEIRKYLDEQKEPPELPANYFYHHGNILIRQNKFQEAFNQYQEAIRIDPKHGNAYNNLANIYFLAKNYEKAWECLKKAQEYGAKVNSKFKEAVREALKKGNF
ncbi:MAG: tetratricopeptide repeat protein [Candidatus Aminicenantales bacterium]